MANVLYDGSVWDARDDQIWFQGITYPRGVQNRSIGYLLEQNKVWTIFEAPEGSELVYEDWVNTLESQAGKPYDSVGILDFMTGIVTGEYSDYNYAPDSPDESKAWFCDEYATWAAGKHGLMPWPIPVPIYTLTPGAALNLFIGAGWKRVAGL